MYFAIIAMDKPNSLQLREDTRDIHRAYLHGAHTAVTLHIAGPLLGDDGKMIGSLILVEAANRDLVEAFSKADPFTKAGLFASVNIHPWNWTTGNPALVS